MSGNADKILPQKLPQDSPQLQFSPRIPLSCNSPQDSSQLQFSPKAPQDYPQPQSAAPQRGPPGAARSPRSARWGAAGCCGACWGCCCCSGGCCCCHCHCWSSDCSPGQRRPQFLCLHLGPHEHSPGNREQKFRFEKVELLSQHPLKAPGKSLCWSVWDSTTLPGKLSLTFPECRGPSSGWQPRTYTVQLLMEGEVLKALHFNLVIVAIY